MALKVMSEEVLTNILVCLCDLVKDTASATRALSFGVLDKVSNLVKYLREALEMTDEFQNRSPRRSFEGHGGQETTEVIVVQKAAMKPCGLVL